MVALKKCKTVVCVCVHKTTCGWQRMFMLKRVHTGRHYIYSKRDAQLARHLEKKNSDRTHRGWEKERPSINRKESTKRFKRIGKRSVQLLESWKGRPPLLSLSLSLFRFRPSEKEWNRLDDAKSRKRENGMPKSQSVCRVYRWKERERERACPMGAVPTTLCCSRSMLYSSPRSFLFSSFIGVPPSFFLCIQKTVDISQTETLQARQKVDPLATWLQHHHQRRRRRQQARHRLPRSFQLIVPAGEEKRLECTKSSAGK